MAIETDVGSGGLGQMPQLTQDPMMQEAPMMTDGLQAENVFEFDDGSAIVGEYEEETVPQDIPFDANLAEYVDEAFIGVISSDLVGSIEDDFSSRQDWEDTYKRGLEYLGMKYEERVEPFEGSSGVIHPLLAESVTQFQA